MKKCYVGRSGGIADEIGEIFYGNLRILKIVKNGDLVWGLEYQGLKFTGASANSTVSLSKFGSPNSASVLYSTDGDTWNEYEYGTEISLQSVGDEVSFRASDSGNQTFSLDDDNRYGFEISGRVACSGHVKCLLSSRGSVSSIPNNAFVGLFKECTGLTTIPSIGASSVGSCAYKDMFNGCTGITSIGTISVSGLSANCFEGMFEGCTGVTSVSALGHLQLAAYCYKRMFAGCTGLTSFPTLNATNLSVGCYEEMFEGCTGLLSGPSLPATTLVNGCYKRMFSGCTGLTSVPSMQSASLVDGCYSGMFSGCSNLKSISTNQTSFTGCEDWVYGVSSSGVFTCPTSLGDDATIARGDSACPTYWYVPTESATSPLSLRAGNEGCSIAIVKYGEPYSVQLYYSMNGGIWNPYTIGNRISIEGGASVAFRARASGNWNFSKSASDYYRFSIDGSCYASGNVMSLLTQGLDRQGVTAYAFANLFNGCSSLLTAPSVPATSLKEGCYFSMFKECSNLTKAPSLPSLSAPSMCYTSMFSGCSNLTSVSDLPATTLGVHCYGWMFEGCAALTHAPKLSAVSTTPNCYNYMFNGCSNLGEIETNQLDFGGTSFWVQGVRNTGTFKCSASLGTQSTIQRGSSACPNNWTVVNV